MLEIAPDLNVTYSVLRLLIKLQKEPWYGLVYYVQDIFTNQQGYCATSIRFGTYYGELSIYVLLLRFDLSHFYNIKDNT